MKKELGTRGMDPTPLENIVPRGYEETQYESIRHYDEEHGEDEHGGV